MTNTPSDAEIDEVTLDVLGYAALDKETNETARMIARAVLAKWAAPQQEAQEPVMISHGRCTIDCGEHGHHDMEMLRMIHAGSKLYTAPQPAPAPLSESEYKRGYRDGYERRDAEVRGALV